MGVTKQYLRWEPSGIFGVVAAKNCNAVYLQPNRFVATGGVHHVTLWDRKLHRQVKVMKCASSPAVFLKPNPDSTMLAVGHLNGALSIYDLKDKSEEASPDPELTFEGHTSTITAIDWDHSGTTLATGGKDTKIILWDCVSETGIAKLKAHKGAITNVRFWKEAKYLLSSSLDSTIHLWDVRTHECVHTIPCLSQVWSFATWGDYLIIAESQLSVLKIMENTPEFSMARLALTDAKPEDEWISQNLGTLLRHANDRCVAVEVIDGRYLVTNGAKSSEIEVFMLSSAAEALKKQKKRLKKDPEGTKDYILRDLVRRLDSVRASEGKIKSVDGIIERDILKLLCCLPTNQMELITCGPPDAPTKPENELLGFDGHRKLVRGVAFSSDKTAILTCAGDSFKIWNRKTLANILTIGHEYQVVCCTFCPGDRHFIAGSTSGHVILADVSTGEILQVEETGSENVWGLDLLPNNMGFVATNGSFLQFYDFFMSEGSLKFELKRQLDVQENILCVKVSPNSKFVAVGLLDSTSKVFFLDTLKFHLSLYGHSLPIVSIDISSDSSIVATASNDKTVKIWGLDFGDCHCTLKHGDGLVSCCFQEKTHYVISVGKDTVNFYDADSHQRIQSLKAHAEGGATCMGIGGLFLATGGRDQTLRLFTRTQDILVAEDELEHEREEELEKAAVQENPEIPGLKTAESERSADKIIEALDAYEDSGPSNPLFVAYDVTDGREYMMKILETIKASEIEQSLMLLPVAYVNKMVPVIGDLLEGYPLATELILRCFYNLLKFHLPSVSISDKKSLHRVADLAEKRQKDLVDTIGFNLAGLKFLYDKNSQSHEIEVFREMVGDRKRKRKKKEKALKRALLQVSLT